MNKVEIFCNVFGYLFKKTEAITHLWALARMTRGVKTSMNALTGALSPSVVAKTPTVWIRSALTFASVWTAFVTTMPRAFVTMSMSALRIHWRARALWFARICPVVLVVGVALDLNGRRVVGPVRMSMSVLLIMDVRSMRLVFAMRMHFVLILLGLICVSVSRAGTRLSLMTIAQVMWISGVAWPKFLGMLSLFFKKKYKV